MPKTRLEPVISDWEILRRVKEGHEASWRQILNCYQPRLKVLAFLITGSADMADDIVQETLVRAVTAEVYHEKGTLSGFLGTIAYRLAVKEARKIKRHTRLAGLDPPDGKEMPLEDMLKDEREKILAECIRNLNTEHSEVLIMKFYGGMTYEEIADTLQIPAGTVKSRLFYAVKSCREMLRQKGIME